MKQKIYSRYSPGKYGLLIDFETSGSDVTNKNHQQYQGISLGALIVNMEKFEVVDDYYVEIKFNASKYLWSEEAEKVHGLTKDYLEANGVSQQEALGGLLEVIMRWIGFTDKLFIMGYNIDFDKGFMQQLFDDCEVPINFHHIMIDPAPMAYFFVQEYRSDKVFELFSSMTREVHNALEDCYICFDALKTMRDVFMKGLE